MKRGILYLQMKYNEKALDDFNQLCDIAEKSEEQPEQVLGGSGPLPVSAGGAGSIAVSKSYFYKAKALKKLDNCNDAILYFEQVIRMCDDQFL